MRIGFVTQLLWDRYGPFWRRLLEDAGAEPVFAELERARAALDDERVAAVPGLAFRLAVAQALALHDVDALVVPALNPDLEIARGGGQDPWVADFPGALARSFGGLPRLLAVPAGLGPEVEGVAVRALHLVLRDAGRVERLWTRHRAGARPTARAAAAAWPATPPGRRVVGLVGQPWLLPLLDPSSLVREGEHPISQVELDPRRLRDEGTRADPRVVPTDAEALGAARLFGRRASITGLRFLADAESGSDAWLANQVRRLARKEVEVVALQDVLAGRDAVDSLWALPVD